MWRFWWSHGLRHRLQQSAEIAVGGDYSGRVFLKRSAHHIEAAKKRIKLLRIRWIECCGIDRSRFGVGFPFNLERVLRRGGTDRGNIAFLLAADVRRLTASLGTEPRSDLMSLARHALNNLLCNRWIVFAALETFVEQFDSVICFSISPRPNSMSGIVLGRSVPLFSSSSSRNGFRPFVTRMISTRSCVATAVRVSLPRMSSRRESALRSSLSRL